MHILKISVGKQIEFINLDFFVRAIPTGPGQWRFFFSLGKSLDLEGQDAVDLFDYIDSLAIALGSRGQ
jgi:hypothetical protein